MRCYVSFTRYKGDIEIMEHLNFADAFAMVGMMFAFAWVMRGI